MKKLSQKLMGSTAHKVVLSVIAATTLGYSTYLANGVVPELEAEIGEKERRTIALEELNQQTSNKLESVTKVAVERDNRINQLLQDAQVQKASHEKTVDYYSHQVRELREVVKVRDKTIQIQATQLGRIKSELEEAKERPKAITSSAAPQATNVVAAPKSEVLHTTYKKKPATSSKKGRTIKVKATAYTAYCSGCSGITAIGINLRKNPSRKVIAVDPRVIPLGSRVWVQGYGYAIAGDTGGAIKGKRIDIFLPTKKRAIQFGVKTLTVRVY